MAVILLKAYRAFRGLDRDVALDLSTLARRDTEAMAASLEWELQRQRILYDTQARSLAAFGIDPPTVLGPRP